MVAISWCLQVKAIRDIPIMVCNRTSGRREGILRHAPNIRVRSGNPTDYTHQTILMLDAKPGTITNSRQKL